MVYPFWKKRIWDISLHVQQIEHCTSRIKMPTTKREIAARNRKNLQFEVYLRHKPLTLGWPGPDLPLFSSSSTIGLIPILAVVFPSFVGFMGNFPLASGSSTSSSICRMANGAFQLVAAAPIFFWNRLRCSVIHEAGPDCERRQGTGILLEFDSSKPSNLLFLPCGLRRKRFFKY